MEEEVESPAEGVPVESPTAGVVGGVAECPSGGGEGGESSPPSAEAVPIIRGVLARSSA